MDVIRMPDELGPMLRAARIHRGLTQADLARQLGVTTQAFSKLESNAGRASFDRVHRLSLLLGLDLALQPTAAGATEANVRQPSMW